MRKGNLGSRLVKKAIAWAMIAMVSASCVWSPLMTANAYAADNEINNYVEDFGLAQEHVDSSAAEYHDNEAAKVAESSESVKAMNEQVDIAQEAAAVAEAAVNAAEKAVEAAQTAATEAQTAASDAQTAAAAGETAANTADDTVTALEEKKTAEGIDAYNDQVSADQNAINNNQTASDAVTNAEAAARTAESEAQKAADAAQAAKEALEKALAVDTDEVNEEVEAAAEEAQKAAEDAAKAADAAEDAKKQAENAAAEAIKQYNLYAMSYGLPLYGEETVTYTDEAAKKAVEAAGMTYQAGEKAALEQEVKDINDTTLADKKAEVDAAVGAFDAAEQKAAAAATAEKDAADAAKKAQKAVEVADAKADKAADTVNNYYVSPAQKDVDDTQEAIGSKNEQIKTLTDALTSATETATAAAEEKYNAELSDLNDKKNDAKTKLDSAQSAYDQAKKDYDDCKWWEKGDYGIKLLKAESDLNKEKDAYNTALSAYNSYNTQSKKDEVINDYVSDDEAVKDASDKLDTANNELAALNAQYTTHKSILDAETATRDAYIKAAQDNASDEAREQFVKEIEKILAQYSAEINQIDYDEALNNWANDTFNSWYIKDKRLVRGKMDDKYVDSMLESLFNTLAITQWIVDTSSAKEVMDAARDAYKASIEQYYEKLATAEANWAAMDTEAAKKAVEDEVKKLEDVNNSIAEANTAVQTADSTLQTAQNTYNDAAKRLQTLKDNVNGKSLNTVSLNELLKKIEAAQNAVDKAEEELKKAEAQKAAAQNYANWASELMKEQYTNVFAQAVADEDGNKTAATENLKDYDLTNSGVTSRPVKDFISVSEEKVKVPYSIYRAYVEAMYDKYQATATNAGKGISTGDSMDVLYWAVDEDGNLTGVYYDSEDELTEGTYFIGYTFKHENDGYHIDGVMWNYAPEKENPDAAEDGPTGGDEPTGNGPTGGDGPTGNAPTGNAPTGGTVTIEDGPVALAAVPAADQAVLGARRVANDADAAVLGAKRGVDQAVLGKRRSPGTGDSSAQVIWMMLLGISAVAAAASATQLKKRK